MNVRDYSKLSDALTGCKVKCKCGHTLEIKPSIEKTTCGYCYRPVKNTSRNRFTYLLLKERNIKDGIFSVRTTNNSNA